MKNKNRKKCVACERVHPVTMFNYDSRFLTGRNEVCKTCTSRISRLFFDQNTNARKNRLAKEAASDEKENIQ